MTEHPRVSIDELVWRGKRLYHDGVLVAQIGIQTETSRWCIFMAYGFTVLDGFNLRHAKRHAEILGLDACNLSELQHDIQMQRDEYHHDASALFH
jgi:hypothetical protein